VTAAPLFHYVNDVTKLTFDAQQAHYFWETIQDVAVVDHRLINVFSSTLMEQEMVTFSLFDENKEQFEVAMFRYKSKSRGENKFTWYGMAEETSSAIIVVDGEDVYATIRTGSKLYQIKSLSSGLSALMRMEESRYPTEHDPLMIRDQVEEEVERQNAALAAENKERLSVITVIIAYTPAAANQVANINALIQLAMDETNEGYALSNVELQLEDTRVYRTDYSESASYSTDLSRFRTKNDGYMDEVHGFRNNDRANMAHLIVRSGSSCGVASTIMASTTTAFCLTAQNCATGYYTFGHEMGHLQGARHNPEQDGSNNPFRYGHGYIIRSRYTRSIMAYDQNGEERVLRWSNPAVDYDGFATGEPDCCNNARVLNETATTVQAWCASGSCA
jgi:hypothetical protein